jgi:hypothetical protein
VISRRILLLWWKPLWIVTVDFFSGDVRNSFLYCGSELDVKYVGLLALWWLAGWCLVK